MKRLMLTVLLVGLAYCAGILTMWAAARSGVIKVTPPTELDAKKKAIEDYKTDMEFKLMELNKALFSGKAKLVD